MEGTKVFFNLINTCHKQFQFGKLISICENIYNPFIIILNMTGTTWREMWILERFCVISSAWKKLRNCNWGSEVNVPKSAPVRTLNKSVTLNKKYRIRLKTHYFISLSVCLCWLVWISQAVFIYHYCPIIFVNKYHWFVLSGLQHCLLEFFKRGLFWFPVLKWNQSLRIIFRC